MNTNRRIAVIVGVLYIFGTIAGILSIAYAVDAPDYLTKASANANQVLIAAFFNLVIVPAYVGVAITLYPLLRQYNPYLAFGSASFQIIGGVFMIMGVVLLLLILTLSQEFVRAGDPGSSYFQTLGGLLQAGRDLVNHVATILAFSIGNLMQYSLLYQTKLVPRWLSGWGLIGITMTILASLLVMFRLIGIITTSYFALTTPLALQAMVMAVWLIVKGFNPSAIASGAAKVDRR